MVNVAIIFIALFGCAMAQSGLTVDKIFKNFAGADLAMQTAELTRFFLQFDANSDGQVSLQEFNGGWRRGSYPNPQKAAFYFLLMDRVIDEVLNQQDYPHIFRLFDENGDGSVSLREFLLIWNAFFD